MRKIFSWADNDQSLNRAVSQAEGHGRVYENGKQVIALRLVIRHSGKCTRLAVPARLSEHYVRYAKP